ncbi:TonB-dependent receptor domain-containing protein [Rugamonas sp. CCM 8940]|uniref:TonB-dependent receptor domain-containing protein n=1 Tax=Rugamonas sp. CCM 8940 TaxID=2765359 RepID=UPI001F1F1EE6|nr:TonB-dependent receptor [Rugamonas sp. CCM 8940]
MARSVRMICVGGVALSMQAAFAQEAPQAIQKVQVTGSRLLSPNADSATPLQILSSADIAASGATNLQELLQKNPTMGTPTLSRNNSNFLTSGGGVTTVNLRNLGDERTLVLVNGRRFVSGVPGSSAVDLNTIPTDFIERVELLTGGASATYGSDAVAGVVNIILKRNFNGVAFDAQTGRSSEGDDFKKKLSLTFGTSSADGASNVMGHLGYSKQGAVFSRDRAASAVDQFTSVEDGDPSGVFKPTRPFYSSYIPAGTFFHDTGKFTYDAAGNVIPVDTNGAKGAPTGFNRSAYRTIAVPTERFLIATTGNHTFNDNVSAYFEGNFASTKTRTATEPFALKSGDIYKATGGQVPAEMLIGGQKGAIMRNPLVPQYLFDRITDNDGDGLRDYSFTRRMSEVGLRTSGAERDTFRIATGLKGTVKDWNYDTYIVYGKTKESQGSTGQVNVLNFRNALEAVTDVNDDNHNNSTTDVICADANARALGCVPANIFGAGKISPEALKYIIAPSSLETAVTQKLAGGSISGEIFDLPAGKVGLAVGFEWREETSSSVADPLTQAGLNAGNAIPPTVGSFHVREFFAETRVPLLKDQPFAKSLAFTGAFRNGKYSTVGVTNSWNAGLEWSPVSDIKFRGTRALSTRAPNISELYQPPSQTFPNDLTDPCDGLKLTSVGAAADACRSNPYVLANMKSNGGTFTLSQADQQGISGYDRGNAGLKAEKGRSTTLGVVITPRSIPMLSKFTFTADYFNIKIADAIVTTPRTVTLTQCYGGSNTSLCKLITRRTSTSGDTNIGAITYIDASSENNGGRGTEGVDMTLSWSDKVGPGRLSANVAYTYLKDFYDIPLKGVPEDSGTGEVGFARNKAVINLAYKWGAWGVTSTTSYTGPSALDDQWLAGNHLPAGSVKVGSKTYNDFQFTYAANKSVELYLGINNAFDAKAPPIITGISGNTTGAETNASVYDPIGRRYYLGVRGTL